MTEAIRDSSAHRIFASCDDIALLGLPPCDAHDLRASPARFGDGGAARIEIPSVEGPEAMRIAIDRSHALEVPLHRVSQGSGIWMLSDDDLTAMAALGRDHGVEVVLFVGPRAAWGAGVQARTSGGAAIGGALRGMDELAAGIDDVLRAAQFGIDGVLVADLGQLMVLGRLKQAGRLPASFQLKVSVALPVANAATARVLEDLGATSLNLPVDLPLSAIAAIRQAVSIPLDVYVESPDDFGGVMRHYDIPQLVRVAAPIYLKFTARNATYTYPSGVHLQPVVEALTAERVRRAALGLGILRRYTSDAVLSPVGASR